MSVTGKNVIFEVVVGMNHNTEEEAQLKVGATAQVIKDVLSELMPTMSVTFKGFDAP